MNEKVADLLREGLALIEDEPHWTTDVYQYRHVNNEVAYCSIGALRKVSGVFDDALYGSSTGEVDIYEAAVVRLGRTMRPDRAETEGVDAGDAHAYVVGFNDRHSHSEVVGMFKQAIIDEETSCD